MTESQPPAAETRNEPELTGCQLGDYQLLRRLGRGGMADVYLAEQQSLRRRVAFKVLKRGLADDESYVRRFHNEAQAAASLVQANIVQIYEVGCIDDNHFIAQEYVAGQNLKQLVARRGTLDAKLAVHVMRQVAAALYKAGKHGIIHRDIKPENIMLATNGEVKVADFGLARVNSDDSGVALTQVGITMGTPLYMSPEQVEGKAIDPRSDIYSFGVTCYEVLAGRPPFEGDTALIVAVQHLKNEPAPLNEFRPDLPAELCEIVHKMLAKDPAKRYQDSNELLRHLRTLRIEGADEEWPDEIVEWLAEGPSMSTTRVAATQKLDAIMKGEVASKPRRARRVLIALSLVVLAFLAGGVVALTNRPAPLLYVSPDELPKIARQPSVEQQYRYAYWLKTDHAWKAVEEYFPPKQATDAVERLHRQLYIRRADQRLAEHYLRQDNLDQALEYFTKLAELPATEEEFRAFGMAGQAIVYSRMSQPDKALERLALVMEQRQHLDDDMKKSVEELYQQLQER